MNGALPPSSSDIFFTVPAHCAISFLPTSVDPVKVSLRTVGFDVISPPIAAGAPECQRYLFRRAGELRHQFFAAFGRSGESQLAQGGIRRHPPADRGGRS